jgi:hypothetical protein
MPVTQFYKLEKRHKEGKHIDKEAKRDVSPATRVQRFKVSLGSSPNKPR